MSTLTRQLILFAGMFLACAQGMADSCRGDDAQNTNAGVSEDGLRFQKSGRLLSAATVRVVTGGDRCSGVLVSRDGHVLTVSHGMTESVREVIVQLADGQAMTGAILARDSEADAALIKCDLADRISLPEPLALSVGEAPRAGEVVLAAGYPGREDNPAGPVIRLGQISAADEHGLRTTCTLTAGDSGGPLVTTDGVLVGLHRQIGAGTLQNRHVSVQQIRNSSLSLDKFLTAVVGNTRQEPSPAAGLLRSQAATHACPLHQVEVHAFGSGGKRCNGTLLAPDLAVTKLSELNGADSVVCRRGQETWTARVASSSVPLDLAVLCLESSVANVPDLVRRPDRRTSSESPQVLELLFSLANGSDHASAGIVSRARFDEPGLTPSLGAELRLRADGRALETIAVAANSAAETAGLEVGDRVIRLSGSDVKSLNEVQRQLSTRQPGDLLFISLQRGDRELSLMARLQNDPAVQFARTEFLDGRSGLLSERRTGFRSVIQHDMVIEPRDCGGPLCNFRGDIVGINIARRARESTLALPLDQVLKFCAAAIGNPAGETGRP